MKLKELKVLLDQTGFPVTYHHWQVGQAPDLPYIVYYEEGTDGFFADNKNLLDVKDVSIELYFDFKDEDNEAKIEQILEGHELPYSTFEAWIESEKMFEKAYEINLI